MRLPATLVLAATASIIAGCAAPAATQSDAALQTDSQSEGAVIAEVGSPRDRARAHTELAAAYYDLGRIGVALDEARIALASDPRYAPAYNVLGLVHMDLKENPEAQASFERALEISPTDPDANHNYGWFLCQTGREQQANRYFMAAIRNPLYATPQKSYTLAGLCAVKRNDEAEAIDDFERALRIDPNHVPAVMPLAQLRYRRGELDAARALLSRFNRQQDATAESLWLALRVERRLGDKAAESAYADRLRRNFAGSREYQALLKGLYE